MGGLGGVVGDYLDEIIEGAELLLCGAGENSEASRGGGQDGVEALASRGEVDGGRDGGGEEEDLGEGLGW